MLTAGGNARAQVIGDANPSLRMVPGSTAVFNWGRPSSLEPGRPVRLRLYWTTPKETNTNWRVEWRWVQSIRPGDGPNPPFTSLQLGVNNPVDFEAKAPSPVATNVFELAVTEPVELPDEEKGDYLMARIILRDANTEFVHLLLVELSWEVP